MTTRVVFSGFFWLTFWWAPNVIADGAQPEPGAAPLDSLERTLVGELTIAVVDYPDDGESENLYVVQTRSGPVVLTGMEDSNIAAGSTVRVSGKREPDRMAVSAVEALQDASRSGAATVLGDRTVGVFYVDFNDVGLTAAQMAQAEGAMYTDIYYTYFFLGDFSISNEATVRSSLEEYSYGQVSINADADGDGAFDIHGPFVIDFASTSCPNNAIAFSWAQAVDTLAAAQGIDLSLYQHKVYILPDNACAFRGLGLLDCQDNCRAWSTLASPVQTITHELGHNFGLKHVDRDWNEDGLYSWAETDSYSLMGGGTGFGDPMAPQHVSQLGWLDAFPGSYLDISASGSGTYVLRDNGNLGAEPVAIRLQAAAGPFVHDFTFSYYQSLVAEFGVIVNYFDPIAEIADTVRIFQQFNGAGHDSVFLDQIAPGESFLYDMNSSGFRVGLWVETASSNDETIELSVYVGDTDGDGVYDYEDNCYQIANATQFEADCDGIGNICDGDFNNDNTVDSLDTDIFIQNFLSANAATDLNEDGISNFLDYNILTDLIGQPPGPGGPAASCSSP